MARAGKDINTYIKDLNSLLGKNLQLKLQKHLQKNKGVLFLKPLKLRLFNKGESGDGTKLTSYSKTYKVWKKSKGLRSTPTTLRATGNFYRSMYVHFGQFGLRHVIEIKTREGNAQEEGGRSNSEKTSYLKKKYGANILTLNEKEQKIVLKEVEDFVAKEIEETLGELEIKLT